MFAEGGGDGEGGGLRFYTFGEREISITFLIVKFTKYGLVIFEGNKSYTGRKDFHDRDLRYRLSQSPMIRQNKKI